VFIRLYGINVFYAQIVFIGKMATDIKDCFGLWRFYYNEGIFALAFFYFDAYD
jgi:hypothetical protein